MGLSTWEVHIAPLIKTIGIFVVWLILAPDLYSIDRREKSAMQWVMRNFVQAVCFTSASVFILVALRLYEFISLMILFLAVYCYRLHIEGGNLVQTFKHAWLVSVARMLDFFEGVSVKQAARGWLQGISWKKWRPRNMEPLTVTAIFMFLGMAVIRFFPQFLGVRMSVLSDPYGHMTWAKMIRNRVLFSEGVYPMGYHAVLAVLRTLSQVDLYFITRFIGPIAMIMLLLGFYWFLLKVTRNRLVALIGVCMLGFSTNSVPLQAFARQYAALALEFSMVFIFPGLVFLYEYMKRGEKQDLFLWGFCAANVCFIHTWGAIFLALPAAVLILAGLVYRVLPWERLKKLTVAGLLGAFVGFIPMIGGLLAGIPLHGPSAAAFNQSVQMPGIGSLVSGLAAYLSHRPGIMHIVIASAAAAVILMVADAVRPREKRSLWAFTITVCLTIASLMMVGNEFGFSLVQQDRVWFFFTLMLITAVVYALSQLLWLLMKLSPAREIGSSLRYYYLRQYGASAILILFVLLWIHQFPIKYPDDVKPLEYDSAARGYLAIRMKEEPLTWTIVAPGEQYEEALGYGYHTQLWEFARDYSMEQAGQSSFDIPIPTKNIFIYVEKKPLDTLITNGTAVSPTDKTQMYYRNVEGRTRLEKYMLNWCRTYMAAHKNMKVYYEDKDFVIYKVTHDFSKFVK